MLATVATVIFKVTLIVILIGIMVMLLLAVNYTLSSYTKSQQADADRLRHEVENNDEVISRASLFRNFLARDLKRTGKRHRHQRG